MNDPREFIFSKLGDLMLIVIQFTHWIVHKLGL